MTQPIRIANDSFEVVFDPICARITRYGAINGVNMLWINEKARICATPFEGWLNWGGDKVWLWPEADWTVQNSAPKTPPGDPPREAYGVKVEGRRMRAESPVIGGYGVKIVREIELAERGSKVTLVNRVEQVLPGKGRPVGAWVVTQIPAPEVIYGKLVEGVKGKSVEGFAESPWQDVTVEGRQVTLRRPARPWMKVGLEADVLVAPIAGKMLVAKVVGCGAGEYEACRRAQVFSDPDDSPFRLPGIGAYIELEFTSPVKRLAVGEEVSVTLEWEVVEFGDVAAVFEGLQ
jgi:hypothetical protein